MANVYEDEKMRLLQGLRDFDLPDDIQCLLLRSDGVTPVFVATHKKVSDVLAHAQNTEVTVGGYSRQALTGETVVLVTPNAEARANKATFTSLATGQDVGAVVTFEENGADTVDENIGFYDVTNTPTNGGDIEIRWDGVDGVGSFLDLN